MKGKGTEEVEVYIIRTKQVKEVGIHRDKNSNHKRTIISQIGGDSERRLSVSKSMRSNAYTLGIDLNMSRHTKRRRSSRLELMQVNGLDNSILQTNNQQASAGSDYIPMRSMVSISEKSSDEANLDGCAADFDPSDAAENMNKTVGRVSNQGRKCQE